MDFYIDETVYTGSPEDMSGRLPREVRTYALLDTLGIPFTRVDHDATATIDACLEVEKILGIHICKNLFLCNAQKTRFYLLLMPGNKKFKTKNLSKQINSARLSFAGDEYMEQFLDITPGSVSILGLANDKENQVQLLIDSDVLKDPFLGCHLQLKNKDSRPYGKIPACCPSFVYHGGSSLGRLTIRFHKAPGCRIRAWSFYFTA